MIQRIFVDGHNAFAPPIFVYVSVKPILFITKATPVSRLCNTGTRERAVIKIWS